MAIRLRLLLDRAGFIFRRDRSPWSTGRHLPAHLWAAVSGPCTGKLAREVGGGSDPGLVQYSVPAASAPPMLGTSAYRACAHVDDLPIGKPSIEQSAHAFLKRLGERAGIDAKVANGLHLLIRSKVTPWC
jgi:hypothetical protein